MPKAAIASEANMTKLDGSGTAVTLPIMLIDIMSDGNVGFQLAFQFPDMRVRSPVFTVPS